MIIVVAVMVWWLGPEALYPLVRWLGVREDRLLMERMPR